MKTTISSTPASTTALTAPRAFGTRAHSTVSPPRSDTAENLGDVGELGYRARRDEGRELDPLQAGRDQAVDQPYLVPGRDELRLRLQSVPRADFGDFDCNGSGHGPAPWKIVRRPTQSHDRPGRASRTPATAQRALAIAVKGARPRSRPPGGTLAALLQRAPAPDGCPLYLCLVTRRGDEPGRPCGVCSRTGRPVRSIVECNRGGSFGEALRVHGVRRGRCRRRCRGRWRRTGRVGWPAVRPVVDPFSGGQARPCRSRTSCPCRTGKRPVSAVAESMLWRAVVMPVVGAGVADVACRIHRLSGCGRPGTRPGLPARSGPSFRARRRGCFGRAEHLIGPSVRPGRRNPHRKGPGERHRE